MFFEYELNMKLKQADLQVINSKEEYKEDRKDKRTKIQASQQSELISQRKNNTPPKNFESAGFDNLGGFGLEQFELDKTANHFYNIISWQKKTLKLQ